MCFGCDGEASGRRNGFSFLCFDNEGFGKICYTGVGFYYINSHFKTMFLIPIITYLNGDVGFVDSINSCSLLFFYCFFYH